ncbi:metal-dependent hydrolase [Paenibacillus chungangensis]|uniref:UPF0173 metal-dependent hydrolase ACFQ2I_09600 n=1 Tax=Paenibacillus chungangensis TaxID=696535 RepID=A0ABW3HQA7_9BACL
MSMQLTYHGHSCFEVRSGDYAILIDPYLSGNKMATLSPDDVQVDAILVTHGHQDHVGDTVAIARRLKCPVIANYEISMYFAYKKQLKVKPMHIGGAIQLPWGKVKMTPALHGSALEIGEGEFVDGGLPGGYLVTMGDRTFYHAGDTALFSDIKLIGELNDIHAAALPIGDRFTMGIDDAIIAAKWLGATLHVPMHYNTFSQIEQDPQVWLKKARDQGLQAEVMEIGQTLTIQ